MDTLTVFSGRNRPDLSPVYRLFEQAAGCRVEVERIDHQAVIGRVNDPSRAGVDLLVTNSQLQIDQLRRDGQLDPYAPRVARDYPSWLRAPDYSWISFTAWPRIAMVNRNVLGDDPANWPARLEELTTPRFRNLVASAALREMMQPAYFSALRVARGDAYVEDLLDRLVANGLRIYYSNIRVRQALIREQLAVAFVNCSNCTVFHHEGNRVAEAWLDQGPDDDGTNIEAHTAAVLTGAPNRALARQFLDFLLEPETQLLLARLYGETPVHPDVTFPGVRPLGSIKRLPASLDDILARLPSTHDLMRARGFDITVDPDKQAAPALAGAVNGGPHAGR
jgi:ABC-type Fe3+ transport system substrate-binding protein